MKLHRITTKGLLKSLERDTKYIPISLDVYLIDYCKKCAKQENMSIEGYIADIIKQWAEICPIDTHGNYL